MTDKELKALVASLAVSQKELTASIAASQKELNERLAASHEDTAKQIKQVNKQLGEIGNKWGTFAEGMAIASIKKILSEKFNIPTVSHNVSKSINGESIEMMLLVMKIAPLIRL